MSETKEKFKLLHKPPKGKMGGLLIVLAWILLWNIIFQALHESMHHWPAALQINNWAFFITVTLFFMQEELSMAQRFWHTLVGGAVGLFTACGVVLGCYVLMQLGLPHFTAICLCLAPAIALLILLHPYLPMFFNNVGFCYFIIALIDSSSALSKLPSNLFSLLLGCICLNLGCIVLLSAYKKRLKKKSLAAIAK